MKLSDMLFANAMMGGGGGGGGDLSTAEVTVVNNTEFIGVSLYGGLIEQDGIAYILDINVSSEEYESGTYKVALYKGSEVAVVYYDPATTPSIVISGDISLSTEEEGYKRYVITGDCTITIS